MRRFFSLRSSTPSSENSSEAPPVQTNKKKDQTEAADKVHNNSRSPKEKALRSRNLCLQSENSSQPQLRRSLSFSSTTSCGGEEGGNLNFPSDFSRTPSNCSCTPDQASRCSIHYQSYTPERVMRKSRGDHFIVEKLHEVDGLGSPSSRGYHCSSENSSHSSPISLRSRKNQHITSSNKAEVLDLYIDGEHQVVKPIQSSSCHSSSAVDDAHLAEKMFLPKSGKPPRVKFTRLSLPDYDKENLHTYSFREESNIDHHNSSLDSMKNTLRLASTYKQNRNSEKLSQASAAEFLTSHDYDSVTTTTMEDFFDNSSDAQTSFNPSGIPEVQVSDFTSSYENMKADCSEELLTVPTQKGLLENTVKVLGVKLDKLHEQVTDEELLRKVKEMQEKFIILSEEDPEVQNYRAKGSNIIEVLRMIKNINEDRKYLVLELSSQIKCRLSERFTAKEQLKQTKMELDTRTRRLEKEKNELQLSLEKELDRRSNDWSLKLGKFQSEEQRLRERVRELAEQNVSLQREVSSLKTSEIEAQSRTVNMERQSNDVKARLEEETRDNHCLHQSFSELQNKLNVVEEDHCFLKKSFKDKEKEIKQFEKVVIQLQRKCNEQEKTITGLRQGYDDDLSRKPLEEADKVSRLQMEQLRLTGVEMMLRREIESCRLEIESLRHENLSLLDRFQGTGEGSGFSFLRLDQELRARVDYLQNLALSLLDDHSHFCSELLDSVKCKEYEHLKVASNEPDGHSVTDYILKYRSLKRGTENLKRSLQTTLSLLDEKSTLESSHFLRLTSEDGKIGQLKDQMSEKEMDFNLKAEAILSKVLKEKLCFKEVELEQLQADLASSIRAHDVLLTTRQRLQDELSCLTHRIKEMELQITKKNETINQLQLNIQESMKELSTLQAILRKVSEERDHMFEEVKQLRKTNKLMDNEVSSLRKKIETLDEDILLKEGQISILRDSMDKPFKPIYNPEMTKEFTLE